MYFYYCTITYQLNWYLSISSLTVELADSSHWHISICFLTFLLLAKYIVCCSYSYSFLVQVDGFLQDSSIDCRMIMEKGKKNKKLFWVPAIAPLISVILSTFIVYITRADKHGVQIASAV